MKDKPKQLREQIYRGDEVKEMVQLAVELREKVDFIAEITPELARWFSENRRQNRNINQSDVDCWVSDMRAGRWRRTHQGIGLDKSGKLADGQHRMAAVSQAGLTIQIQITVGLTEEDIRVLDGGRRRSLPDRFLFDGNPNMRAKQVAVGKAIRRLSPAPEARRDRMSDPEEMEWLTKHIAAIQFAIQALPEGRHGVSQSSVAAVLARAYYTQPQDRLQAFARLLIAGQTENLESGDRTALKVRDQLAKQLKPAAVYLKVERALSAFIARQDLKSFPSLDKELFYLPEEQRAIELAKESPPEPKSATMQEATPEDASA